MKKIYSVLLGGIGLMALPTQAQTLLDEDFETGSTETYSTQIAKGEGWTTVNSYSGDQITFNWHNYYSERGTISGTNVAGCDAPTYESDPRGGFGPREEILLSPELYLDNTYELKFTWEVSPMNAYASYLYDLQVRVVVDGDLQNAETVFSIQNQAMLKESGVLDYPISTWDPRTSSIDLSDWQGKKVKIAFVHKMLTTVANVAWIDDVTVKQFTPATGPVGVLSLNRFDFGTIYMGEKVYSDVITLTNQGLNGLKITGIDAPQGITTTLDLEKINLDKNESTRFQIAYEASLTSPAQGNVVLHTTGGDVTIAFTGTKQVVPEGYELETFNQYYPPAGWKSNGWGGSPYALEGDQSAYCGGGYSNAYLTSPRLDLSQGGQLTFTYFNEYDDYEDNGSAPEYDISVQVSYDGGETWTSKWISDYTRLNERLTATVDLGTGTDNSYVRWYYPAVETDEEGDAYDHSSFYLDRVLLPHVYGIDGAPIASELLSPADGLTEVFPKDIVLEWAPAQFALGYRLYVGSNSEATNLIDGLVLGNVLTYTIASADYETTYTWKVVPYNAKGDAADVPTRTFTTQKDASTADFPYYENFDRGVIPTGWLSTTTAEWENRRWEPLATAKAYGGSGASLYTMWLNAGKSSTVTTQEFQLPANKNMAISFVWGDNHPVDLIIDESGLLKKENVQGGNGYSDVVFEVYADGQWTQESYLSEDYNADGETKYWRDEHIDLSKYAGKTVQFRWTNNSYGGRHRGAGLDNVAIEEVQGDKVIFNKPSWDAEKVNYNKATNSGDIFTFINKGINTLKIKEVTFDTQNFESSLTAGTEVAPEEGQSFSLTFLAKDAQSVVSDVMTIEFESGYKATFPVKGEGLAEDVLYYSFEPNPLDYEWKTDFTQIDVDKKNTYELSYYLTEVENDGQRYAFTQVTNNNVSMLAAHSGNHTIAAAAPADNSAADDWLISKQICPAAGATFEFYARNLGTTNSVFVGDNDLHRVSVLVSEGGNSSTASFKVLMKETEMPYLAENEWNHYKVDLSEYAGKNIYVAVRHTTISANWFAFFDDFTFTHVGEPDPAGIQQLSADIDASARVEVFSLGGMLLQRGQGAQTLQSLSKGIYVVKIQTADGTRTLRVTRN